MGTCCYNLLSNLYYPPYLITNSITKFCRVQTRGNSLYQKPSNLDLHRHRFDSALVGIGMEEIVKEEVKDENHRRFRWTEIGHNITHEQNEAISKLPFKMTKRCKALMRQIICFSAEKGNVSDLLNAWVKIMKPIRAEWLSVLKELETMEHPLYLEVFRVVYVLFHIAFPIAKCLVGFSYNARCTFFSFMLVVRLLLKHIYFCIFSL